MTIFRSDDGPLLRNVRLLRQVVLPLRSALNRASVVGYERDDLPARFRWMASSRCPPGPVPKQLRVLTLSSQ
jgi:hypothetical protein